MKKPKGYDEAMIYTDNRRLPAGGYVVRIDDVTEGTWASGRTYLDFKFDIAEGEYKDYYTKQFEDSTLEDKKYKGNATVYVPKDDGSEKDGWTKKSFAGWTNAFEESNQGYSWDWDEKKWKGKLVGIVFGDTGTVIEGKEIVYTEPRFAVAAQQVRDGNAPAAKFKAKNGYTGNGSSSSGNGSNDFVQVPETDLDELPFN